jgi:hypothetical protein
MKINDSYLYLWKWLAPKLGIVPYFSAVFIGWFLSATITLLMHIH